MNRTPEHAERTPRDTGPARNAHRAITTGWRLTDVYSDGTTYGYTVTPDDGPLLDHDTIMARIEAIQMDAKINPDQWPGFIGCGMEFVDGVQRQ